VKQRCEKVEFSPGHSKLTRLRGVLAAASAVAKFYSISCPEQIMRARVLARSENPPVDSLWINMAAYDKLKAGIEPMQNDEDFVRIDGTA